MIDDNIEDLPLGREVGVEPGLFVERRSFVTSLASALVAAGLLPHRAYAHLSSSDTLSYEEFLAVVQPIARKLVGDASADGQDVYLRSLAEHGARLSDAPQPKWNDGGQSLGPGTFIGASPAPDGSATDPFIVLHWRMDPGTRVETHAHTHGNVCTIGLEGETQISNFEMEGPRDFETSGTFVARRTNHQKLVRGSTNLVNLERNYIHNAVAGPSGGRGLDITTRVKPRYPRVPYLKLERRKPGDAPLFEATWSDLAGMKAQDPSLLKA